MYFHDAQPQNNMLSTKVAVAKDANYKHEGTHRTRYQSFR